MGALGFSFGSGSFNAIPTVSVQPTQAPAAPTSTLGTILNTGVGVLDTVLGYNLQKNQIEHGQVPSIAYDANGRPTGQPVLNAGTVTGAISGYLPLIILALIAVFVLRAVSHR